MLLIDGANRYRKLQGAANYALRNFRDFRERRVQMIREYIGRNYTSEGTSDKRALPLLSKYVRSLARAVSGNNPQYLCVPRSPDMSGYSMMLQLGLNQSAREVDLSSTGRASIMDATFFQGWVKVGLAKDGDVQVGERRFPVGRLFVDRVSFDDICYDLDVKAPHYVRFIMNRETANRQYLLETGYDEELVSNMKSIGERFREQSYNAYTIGRSNPSRGDDESLSDEVSIWNVFREETGTICTFPEDGEEGGFDGSRLLREVEYDGPEHGGLGPYHQLSLAEVPDQAVPMSLLGELVDLHRVINILYNKQIREALNTKHNTLYEATREDDADRLRKARTGEFLGVQNVNFANSITTGGVDQGTFAFRLDGMENFNRAAGNLDLWSGSGTQSETLGQDQILSANANIQLSDVEDRFYTFIKGIGEHMAWYLMYHPMIDMQLAARVGNIDVPVRLTADKRRGTFLDYNIDVQPYSMRHQSPTQKLNTFLTLFERIVLANMPMITQNGDMPDIKEVLKIAANYSNTPELENVMLYGVMEPKELAGEPPEKGMKSPYSNRTYTRRNESSGKGQDQSQVIGQLVAAADREGSRSQ